MYADELTFTYTFMNQQYSNDPISWIRYDSDNNKFVATVTQAEIDLFTGTSMETYEENWVITTLRAVPDYNSALNAYAQFTVHFQNPLTASCEVSTLIAP